MRRGTERFIAQLLGREAAQWTREHLESGRSNRLRMFALLWDQAFDSSNEMSRVAIASELHESCRLAVALRGLALPDRAPDIVVTGLPRSGTTALQNLLAGSSRRASTVVGWLLATSRFEALAQGQLPDRRRAVQEVDARYRAVTSLNPRLASLHPLGAYRLEECTPLYRSAARHFPWAFMQSSRDIEEFLLEDFGNLLVHGEWLTAVSTLPSQGMLVVKSPLHTGYLQSLRATCPLARIVVTRRPADDLVRSFATMVHEARSPFVDAITLDQSGAQALRILRSLAEAFRKAVDNGVEIEVIDIAEIDRSPNSVARRLGVASDASTSASRLRPSGGTPPRSRHPGIEEFGVRREDVEDLAILVPELCS